MAKTFEEQARARLDAELKQASAGKSRYVTAVAPSVHDALVTFCEQQEEFAQAVVQSGKSLSDVCEAATKGCGSSISDLEVYRRAVAAYFPGARVDCVMTIRMSGYEEPTANPSRDPERAKLQTSGVLSLDLFDLMGG